MAKIKVHMAKLTEKGKTFILAKPMTLEAFLKVKKLKYNSSIRVNGKVASKSYMLKTNDFVTIVVAVEGGK